jgi:hypothetical protein
MLSYLYSTDINLFKMAYIGSTNNKLEIKFKFSINLSYLVILLEEELSADGYSFEENIYTNKNNNYD